MSKKYNIIDRLAAKNARPFIQITDDLTVAVDTSKTTVLHFMAIEKDEELDSLEKMDKMMIVALGKKAFEEIEKMDLSFPAYEVIFEAVSAALSGEDLEELAERFPEAEDLN